MRPPDHFDRYDADESPDEDGATCNRCGESGLYWQKITAADGMSEKPVLFSDATRKRHVCKVQDEFEVVRG